MHEQINFDGFATYLREFRLADGQESYSKADAPRRAGTTQRSRTVHARR